MAKSIDWLLLLFQLFSQIGKLLHLAAIDGLEEGFAGGEMSVECTDPDAGRSRDGFEAALRATGTEHYFRRLKDALAVPNSVGARFTRRLVRSPEAGRQS